MTAGSIYSRAINGGWDHAGGHSQPSRPRRRQQITLSDAYYELRQTHRAQHGLAPQERAASYAAQRPSRLRRDRHGIGGVSDSHLGTGYALWRFREYSWAMDRDDPIPGRWVNRALDNVLPLSLDPQTGQPALNSYFKDRWQRWADDKRACDLAGRRTWPQIERLALRTVWLGGDCPVILHRDRGKLQPLEPERLTSPDSLSTPTTDIVHGVEVDAETDEVLRYYFLRAKPGRRSWNSRQLVPALNSTDYAEIPACDDKGRPNVLLVLDPQRLSDTRGVPIFHAGFDQLGMLDDTLFAELVKQQTVSCIPAAITTERDLRLGGRASATDDDDDDDNVSEQLVPGTLPRLRKGESITGVSGAGSEPNFEQFSRFQLRIAALQMGLPYSLLMLDTEKTTFHGYRGEYEQAKLTFKRLHRWYPDELHKPVHSMLVDRWVEEIERGDVRNARELQRAVSKARDSGKLHDVRVQGSTWPYVEPVKDAQADVLRKEKHLASPRQIAAERGRDLDELQDEIAEDNANAIRRFHSEAEALSIELGVEITWQDVRDGVMPVVVAKPAPTQEPASESDPQPEGDGEDAKEPNEGEET